MQQNTVRSALLDMVREGLAEAPAVALLGARQVGKTTLAAQLAAAWEGPTTTFDLEVASVREALSRTPEAVLGECEGLVVIDEVQRLPPLFETLRPICDAVDRKAVFLLLGSAAWDLVRGISETLAGRVLFVDVGGFSLAEVGAEHQNRLGCAAASRGLGWRLPVPRGDAGCSPSRARFWNATFRYLVRASRRKR